MKLLLVYTVCLSLNFAKAETLSFSTVWSQINNNSAAQQSSKLQTEALSEAQSRSSRHWLPRIYLDARGYQTNDPGASFFGLLEQRSIGQADFDPNAINHPESNVYTRGALGLDWAVYEGGIKSSQVDFFKHSVSAQKNATSQIQLEQYSAVGLYYGSIAIIRDYKLKLETLNSEVGRFIKSYQLGSKGNPVGYSGLLGLKSLANRLSGLLNQYEAQSQAHYAALGELGIKNQNWSPEVIDSNNFVSRYFLNFTANAVQGIQPAFFILLLLLFYIVFSIFIQSTSGMAVLTMPIIGALAILVNIPGREIVNSYMYGMCLMSFLAPTGLILPSLAMVNISLKTWFKFIMPLLIVFTIICMIALMIGIYL